MEIRIVLHVGLILQKGGEYMKDERVNLKVQKITRDRLMAVKYARQFKNLDMLLNDLLDNYAIFDDLEAV